MRHVYWNQKRIELLRSLIKTGHKKADIERLLKIPKGVCEGYLSAAIRRYTRDKPGSDKKKSHKENIESKKLSLSKNDNLSPPLRHIPANLKLTEHEKEQAQSSEPLPALHPLTGTEKFFSTFVTNMSNEEKI